MEQPRFGYTHLLALTALAVAQPLFDLLGRYPEFLVAHGVEPWLLIGLTLFVTFAIPTVLMLFGALLRAIWRDLGIIFQWVSVGLLGSLFFIQVFKRGELWLSGRGVLALGLISGGLLALAYARWKPVQGLLTILSFTALIFPLLFLFFSPANRLLRGELEGIGVVRVGARKPVVMVIFDELPLLSLLDRQGGIDAGRFPNFARLAGQSYWFPNASAVSENTLISVPAILDGRYPRPETRTLPTLADHPRNLLTLLQETHRPHMYESITRLAPPRSRVHEAPLIRVRQLLSDVTLVYGHLLLPISSASGLPAITESWKGFGNEETPDPEASPSPDLSSFQADWNERERQFAEFIDELKVDPGGPDLFFVHSMLPHFAWKYLPDGRLYALREKPGVAGVRGPNPEGRDANQWLGDPWLPLQAQQRHLLQVGYVDTLLGRLLDRLQEVGLYEDCLLVITSDHGTSFQAEDSRREISQTNYPATLGVPLFIKAPGQRVGEVIRRNVQSIDILPTVADLLEVDFSWEMDGQSAIADDWVEPPVKRAFADQGVAYEFPRDWDLSEFLSRRIGTLGDGDWESVYRLGEGELLGREVVQLPSGPRAGRVSVNETALLSQVDPENSRFIPALISGTILGLNRSQSDALQLAVAVNGRVEALTRTSPLWGENRDFLAVVPPHVLRQGVNRVDVYRVEADGRLGLLEQDRPQYRLALSPLRLVQDDGKEIAIEPGHNVGWVVGGLRPEGEQAFVGGWMADREHLVPVEAVLVFLGDRLLTWGRPNLPRADAVRFLKSDGVRESGFEILIPPGVLPADLSTAAIRVFGLSTDGFVAELNYPNSESGNWAFLPVSK